MNDRLALGTVQFGLEYGVANESGRVSFDEADRILAVAAGHGIKMLDTAIAYGESEDVLGRIGMAGWSIVTKLPAIPDGCMDVAAWVDDQISGSLARLGVGRIHGVLLHRSDQLFGLHGRELRAALEGLKVRGLTDKIGVSVYSPDELERLFDIMNIDLVQAPLNILDRRLINSGWGQRLKNRGVELHVRSAFMQGLLLMSDSRRPEKFGRWQNLWLEWERWLNETGLSPLEACLRFVLSVKEVDKVVVGVDSLQQLREILAAAGGVLTSLPNWPETIDNDLVNPAQWSNL